MNGPNVTHLCDDCHYQSHHRSHTALQSSVKSMPSIQKLDEHSPLPRATVNANFTDALRLGEYSDHHRGDVNTRSDTEEL